MSNVFTLYTQPYLSPYAKCYTNVIIISCMPNGLLRLLTHKIKFQNVSAFNTNNCINTSPCKLVLNTLTDNNMNNLMTADEIPNLINYLLENNYSINTDITNMINNNSNSKLSAANDIICFASYNY